MKLDLTPAAQAGFVASNTDSCPHVNTSPASDAWHAGRWLQKTGRTAPRDVSPSRGHRLHVNDMVVIVNTRGEVTRIA